MRKTYFCQEPLLLLTQRSAARTTYVRVRNSDYIPMNATLLAERRGPSSIGSGALFIVSQSAASLFRAIIRTGSGCCIDGLGLNASSTRLLRLRTLKAVAVRAALHSKVIILLHYDTPEKRYNGAARVGHVGPLW